MKKYLLVLLLSVYIFGGDAPRKPMDRTIIEKNVADLLAKMTLEEKVGQMTQITIQVVSKQQGIKTQDHILDEKALEEAILKYHVGSILNVYDKAHSVAYWHEIITKIQDLATKKTRLSVPVLYGIDAIHGATYTQGATLFPQAISMAATFNKELELKAGEITAREVRASGIPWNFYPVMDVGRQVLWSRFWETFGEDTYLAGIMGSQYITGSQGTDFSAPDKAATCLKHYVGYSFPMNGKDRTPAWISERMLREYFLPPFEAGIKAGAMSVMVNSSEVDGIPGHSDHHLLTDILRGELKFEGIAVSDWEDIKRLYTRDHVASSPSEAVKIAVLAGIDMSMIPLDYSFYDLLLELVKKNEVPMSRIDEAVTRILRVKMMLGLFENAYPDAKLASVVATPENGKANLEAAEESIVMTRNQNSRLPLNRNSKLLVTGPTANMLSVMNGGWTITWQGNEESLYPKSANTVYAALKNVFGENNVQYSAGTSFDSDINTDKTVEMAKNADAIVVCLGETAYCETPGNINELDIDPAQQKLVFALAKTNKPIILVMLQGRPRIIRMLVDKTDAVLVAMLPGMRGGDAIANIIAGNVVPSGKLPFTYPKYANALYHYDQKPLEQTNELGYDPQWGFGFGLSYTSFSYSNLKIDKKDISGTEEVKVTVDVTNTGKVAGLESVQLYLRDLVGSVSRPLRQLRGFEKVSLQPGETKTVSFVLDNHALSFIGRENKRITEPGEFAIYVANLEQHFFLH